MANMANVNSLSNFLVLSMDHSVAYKFSTMVPFNGSLALFIIRGRADMYNYSLSKLIGSEFA